MALVNTLGKTAIPTVGCLKMEEKKAKASGKNAKKKGINSHNISKVNT